MISARLLRTLALATTCGTVALAQAAVVPGGVDAAAAFERLTALQGTWETRTAKGQIATTTFELTANGTVLLERYSNPALPGGGTMVTAYHLDGTTLILTHYCIAKNQPTLKADRFDALTGEIQFEFLRASNLAKETSGHMRRALYRLEDTRHFTTSWEFFQDGKQTMTETELSLKTAGGFGVAEIASAFLASETTIAQRLVRAKRTLREHRIGLELPSGAELASRVDSVLEVTTCCSMRATTPTRAKTWFATTSAAKPFAWDG
jgi:hypothetical protein